MRKNSPRLLHDGMSLSGASAASITALRRSYKGGGGDLHYVYGHLRQGIISGEIGPKQILNQVHIAQELGVSRTPVREALRMLQTENLVETQYQHRVRVTEITPQEVDSVYATWLLVQSLAISLTLPRISREDLEVIRRANAEMNSHKPARAGTTSDWENLHGIFHRSLIMYAGPVILESIESCWSRSERARRAYIRTASRSWMDSEEEHNDLVRAYTDGDVTWAISVSTRQLARIARIVIGNIDPSYEPVAIQRALGLLAASAPWAKELASRPNRNRMKGRKK